MKRVFCKFLFVVLLAGSLLAFAACDNSCNCHTHDLSIVETVVEPTCISQGVIKRKCSQCDYYEMALTDRTQHEFTVTDTVESTCAASGFMTKKCSICGTSEVEYIPVKQHEFTVENVSATCYNRGYKIQRCSACGFAEIEYTTQQPLAHDYVFDSRLHVKCGQPFVDVYKCSACGAIEHRDSDIIAQHVFNIEKKESTCVAAGYEIKTCVYCDYSSRVDLPLSGHNFKTESQSATCCEKGVIYKFCTNEGCGYMQEEAVLDYAAHSMKIVVDGAERFVYSRDGINIYSDPDCHNLISTAKCNVFADGMHFLCVLHEKCGMSVEAEAHTLVQRDTATCEEAGETTMVCIKCGYQSEGEYSPPKGHNDSGVKYFCMTDDALTREYHNSGGDPNVSICYRCSDCGKYIPAVPHTPNISSEQVTCLNPQYCTVCGSVMLSKEHVAPQLTCVSTHGDEFYYCASCGEWPMGKLTAHQYEIVDEEPATCVDDKVCYYECPCGDRRREVVAGTRLGHAAPGGVYPCVTDSALSSEYYNMFGERKDIAYKCFRCGEYIETIPHQLNCGPEEVTCLNDQHCLLCGTVFMSKPHEAPEFTCVSSHGDGYYYCKNCNQVPMGELTEHNFNIEKDRFGATCKENARVYFRCVCGTLNPDGYEEIAGTRLGHMLPNLTRTARSNCLFGHIVHFDTLKCMHDGCDFDLTALADENGDIYCLDINNYLYDNGYADDYLTDEKTGLASNRMVITMLSCCESTGYRFIPSQHELSSDPVSREDEIVNGTLYKYIPSTCATKGSALFICEKCGEYVYIEHELPLNPLVHEGELLYCNEHCPACAPEDGDCMFAFEILVYRSSGEEATENGLKKSAVYGMAFMSQNDRMTQEKDSATGQIYYRLTDEFIAELTSANGPCFKTAAGAGSQDYNDLFDWSSVRLYKNQFNSITIYILGANT